MEGQNGAPIILIQGDNLSIVGIHRGGIKTRINDTEIEANVGKLITKEIIDLLRNKAIEFEAEPFNEVSYH